MSKRAEDPATVSAEIGPLLCVVALPRSAVLSRSTHKASPRGPRDRSPLRVVVPRARSCQNSEPRLCACTHTFVSASSRLLSPSVWLRDGARKMYGPKDILSFVSRTTEREFRGTRVSYMGAAPETRASLHEPRKMRTRVLAVEKLQKN